MTNEMRAMNLRGEGQRSVQNLKTICRVNADIAINKTTETIPVGNREEQKDLSAATKKN